MTNDIKYEQRVTFFIDILGFKEMIDGQKKRTPNEIVEVFNKIEDNLNSKLFGGDKTIQVTQFSDSVIMSFKIDEPSKLIFVLIYILHLQFELIVLNRVLIRGACAFGETIHNENFVFGSAINQAYNLEEKCAIYPRIIISEDIIDACSNYSMHEFHDFYTREDEKKAILRLLKQDTDGYYYIDYLSYNVVDSEMDYDTDWAEYMQIINDFIQSGLKEKNPPVKQKYLWLKDKYNKALTDVLIDNYNKNCGILLERIE